MSEFVNDRFSWYSNRFPVTNKTNNRNISFLNKVFLHNVH
jgi:hypothetical protein